MKWGMVKLSIVQKPRTPAYPIPTTKRRDLNHTEFPSPSPQHPVPPSRVFVWPVSGRVFTPSLSGGDECEWGECPDVFRTGGEASGFPDCSAVGPGRRGDE